MLNSIFILIVAMGMVIKGATMATTYAERLAKSYRLSEYAVGFIIVSVISVLPEAFIAINSAIEGVPSFGLAMLFGSNITDLTLIFAIIVFYAGRGLKIESKVLKNHATYSFVLLLPLVLGLDGHFSRLEGLALIIAGLVFYYSALREGMENRPALNENGYDWHKSFLLLMFSMVVMVIGAYFTVTSATSIASHLNVSPILIGMLIVGLGTAVPELFFSLKSVKRREDSLAVGDILGIVLADATIVVGILALIDPFFFPQKIIYVTGAFMIVASFILFHFMRSRRTLSKREASLLLVFWLVFVSVEFIITR